MAGARVLQVRRPFDQRLLAELPQDAPTDLEHRLTAARAAFEHRSAWPPPHERGAALERLAALTERDHDAIARLIAEEGGKPLTDARVEARRATDTIRLGSELLRGFAGREIPMGLTPASTRRWAFTTREPIGVVGAISAFNHPFNLIAHQAVPAIATGCPVVLKPTSRTPLSCLRFLELAREAGIAAPWCTAIITADHELSERLATDARVAFLSFIGSAEVGWGLQRKLAPGMRSALEHGGAAPVIVDRDADLDAIIAPLAKGAYYHAGQVCVSVQRIFVHAAVHDDFVAKFAARVGRLKVGDPTEAATEVGPLIAPAALDRVAAWVDEAVGGGAGVAVGGQRLSETLYAPTVLLEPPEQARVSREEVFGPVACVYRYTSMDQAIARANQLVYAFQAAVFTRDLAAALHAVEHLWASAVMVNDHTAFRTDWMPFAGLGQSGYGVGGVPAAMAEMTQEKMVVFRLP